MSLTDACAKIKLILTDVDGVLTDGGIQLSDNGDEIVTFHIRDGMGVRLWRRVGRPHRHCDRPRCEGSALRAKALKLDVMRFGIDDKLPVVDEIAKEQGLKREQICFLGDDLLDLKAVQAVGLGVAVADAAEEVRKVAKYVTSVPGGRAPLRELIELILKNTGRWEGAIRPYAG